MWLLVCYIFWGECMRRGSVAHRFYSQFPVMSLSFSLNLMALLQHVKLTQQQQCSLLILAGSKCCNYATKLKKTLHVPFPHTHETVFKKEGCSYLMYFRRCINCVLLQKSLLIG